MAYQLIYRVDLGNAQSPFRVVAQPTGREVGWINRFLDQCCVRGLAWHTLRGYAFALMQFVRWWADRHSTDEVTEQALTASSLLDYMRDQAGRAAEARRMKGDGYEPVLTKSRWCLLKRPENLNAQQNLKLKDLVRYNLQSVRAYLLKEDFRQLWNYESTAWAAKFLDQWCHQVMRSRIEPMKEVARTLRAHRDLILNYFRARKEFSSGVIEGLNNKAKVTMRRSYGFRTFRVTELALYHSLGKLPEPELTHRFF